MAHGRKGAIGQWVDLLDLVFYLACLYCSTCGLDGWQIAVAASALLRRPHLSTILRPDTLEQPLLNVVQDGIVLHDGDVLRLALELLVGVLAGAEHGRRALGTHLAHLLGHLVGGCAVLEWENMRTEVCWRDCLTIVAAEKEDEDGAQTEDAEEVPADAGHPARVELLGHDARLEHALELEGDGEGEFHCKTGSATVQNRARGTTGGSGTH